MDRNYRKPLLVGSLMLVCAYANGQEATKAAKDSTKKLKEVVIHNRGSSTQISMLDPIKKELISSQELLKAACCNLSESFETTPSVDVAFTDAVSGYKQIQMLGLASPYTLITRENIPDTRGLAAITGLNFTPGTFIDGMQLSKGTGSVVNGYESLAGQINVEWKKPFKETDEKALFNLYQNSQGRTEGNIVFRHQFNEALSSNLFVNARSQWLKQDGNKDGFLDQPLDKQLVVANRWFWFAPKKWEVQGGVKGSYLHNTGGQWDYKEGMEQIPGRPWGYNMDLQRAEGWAKIGKIFNKPGTSMGLQLSGVYHDQDAVLGATNYAATQKTFYANLIYQTIIGNTNHVIKTGISNMVEQYDETYNGTKYLRNELVPGVFAEYTHNFSDKLNVVAGLRGDYHNIYGAFATPRLHIRYAPFKKTVFRASAGRAQRTANVFAENMGIMASNRTFVIQSTNLGNPYGLAPEVAWNMGLNFTQKFTIDYRDGAFSVDYYYTSFQNHIVMDVGSPYKVVFYNLNGIAFAHSLQAQLDYELIHNLDFRLSYRWYDTRTTFNGNLKERILVPSHRAFANIGYKTRNNWKFDYTVQLIGSKRIPTLYDNAIGQTIPEHYSPWYWQMSAQVTKKISEAFDIYVGGENLTNYRMAQPIVGAANPYGPGFDASMVWGPIMGSNFYGGFRYKIR
ncbi:MAG: TonB-dependent receptor [Bacteroidetes bacterium]|nr:TonB-dependent receptor [Bacteroidota bacterium]